MIFSNKKILPVILGGGLNGYSIARSFYEEYGAVSHVFSEDKNKAFLCSKFIIMHLCSGLCDVKIAIPELLDFAYKHQNHSLYLFAADEKYADVIINSKNILSQMYFVPYPDKYAFDTVSADCTDSETIGENYRYSVGNVVKYGTKRFFMTFSDDCGEVVRAVYGNVLLSIKDCGLPFCAALTTIPLDGAVKRIITYLNEKKYRGFANFDILIENDGRCSVDFSTYTRAECDCFRAMGNNIAVALSENRERGKVKKDFMYREIYWRYPPHKTVKKLSSNEEGKMRANMLRKRGLTAGPFDLNPNGIIGKIRNLIEFASNFKTVKRDIFLCKKSY